MKEVDGRMKLAISALIRSTITPDLELRSGSSQSLSRIARVQPITVLSEWLVVLSSEREKLVKTQHGKKKSQEGPSEEKTFGPACLVTSLVGDHLLLSYNRIERCQTFVLIISSQNT